MSNAERTPAVYKITNKLDGRVYIGSTKNLSQRWKQYISAVDRYNKTGYLPKSQNPILIDIATLGWDNFEFKILKAGGDMFDQDLRAMTEVEYIMKYRSIHPEFGYNATFGGETGPAKHRIVKNRKPKPLILFDTKTGEMDLYFTGTKQIPAEFHCKQDKVSDALIRGKLFKNRYFIFYADTKFRTECAELKAESILSFSANGDNDKDSRKRYDMYVKALHKVNKFAADRGF